MNIQRICNFLIKHKWDLFFPFFMCLFYLGVAYMPIYYPADKITQELGFGYVYTGSIIGTLIFAIRICIYYLNKNYSMKPKKKRRVAN